MISHTHSIGAPSIGIPSMGYSSGAATSPRDMSALENALNSNFNGLAEIDSALDQLEKRLYAVLRPVPPQTAGDSKGLAQVSPAQSQAVDQLHAQRSRMELLINRVNDLAARFD